MKIPYTFSLLFWGFLLPQISRSRSHDDYIRHLHSAELSVSEDLLPVGRSCLSNVSAVNEDLKMVNYIAGSTSPVLIGVGDWTSSRLAGVIIGIILKELMGYDARVVMGLKSSQTLIRGAAGCKDPTKTGDVCAANWPNAWVHITPELWEGYMNKKEIVPWEDAYLAESNYKAFEGIFVPEAPGIKAYQQYGLHLWFHKTYDAAWNGPKVASFFNTTDEVAAALPNIKCVGHDAVLFSHLQERVKRYLDKTNDAAGVNATTWLPQCDQRGFWLSPACRANPNSCIPMLTTKSYGLYMFMSVLISSFKFNWSIALADIPYSDWKTVTDKVNNPFFWWRPDDEKSHLNSKARPLHIRTDEQDIEDELMNVDEQTIWRSWSPNVPGRVKDLLKDRLVEGIGYRANLQNLNQITEIMHKTSIHSVFEASCEWIRENMKAVEEWVPKERCGAGYQQSNNNSQCDPCNAGLYCEEGRNPEPCPGGYYCPQQSSKPTFCEAGYYCPPKSSAQIPCSAGRYGTQAGKTDNATCIRCPIDYYQNERGSNMCLSCADAEKDSQTFGILGAYTKDACILCKWPTKTPLPACAVVAFDTLSLLPTGPAGAVCDSNTVRLELGRVLAIEQNSSVLEMLPDLLTAEERRGSDYELNVSLVLPDDREWPRSILCPFGARLPRAGFYRFPPNSCIADGNGECPLCPVKSMPCIACPATNEVNLRYTCSDNEGCSSNNSYTGCAEGYTGILCATCATGFTRSGATGCKKCYGRSIEWALAAWGVLVIFCVIAGLAHRALHRNNASEKNSEDIIMLKIFLTHLQTLGLMRKFSFDWRAAEKLFSLSSEVSGGVQFSSWCTASEMRYFASPFYTEAVAMALLPWVIVALLSVFMYVRRRIRKANVDSPAAATAATAAGSNSARSAQSPWRKTSKLRRISYLSPSMKTPNRVIVTTMVTMFCLYLPLCQISIELFTCIGTSAPNPEFPTLNVTLKLDGGKLTSTLPTFERPYGTVFDYGYHTFLSEDTRIECWEGSHLGWSIGLGGTMLVLYAIGCPLLVFCLLSHIKSDLKFWRGTFGFMYRSFKDEFWYWECMVFIRKLFFVIAAVAFRGLGPEVQTSTGIVILVIAFGLQVNYKPYAGTKPNMLECSSFVIMFFTLICGINLAPMVSGNNIDRPRFVVLTVLIFVLNCAYIGFALVFILREVCTLRGGLIKKRFTKVVSVKDSN